MRDFLELAVRDDLLGPAGGPHELIKDMSVRDRYLVGKLAPRRPDDDQSARIEPASAAEEAGDLEDERAAPLHEPGAEFASASGRVEPEDDALDEIDTTNNQSLVRPAWVSLSAWRRTSRHWPSTHDGGVMNASPTMSTRSSRPARTAKPATRKR